MKLLSREPVLCVALLSALLALLAAFGVDLSPEAQAGLSGVLAALLAIVRSTVTPAPRVAEAVDLAAHLAATSVARNITPELAGAAGNLGDTAAIIEGATDAATAVVSR